MFISSVYMIESEARKASEVILSGGIILYPTDTIWGIGCDATRPEAVQRIYELKQRKDNKSMLVLVDGIRMLKKYLTKVPAQAQELLTRATKPTTIIYPGARHLAKNLVAVDGSIGIRIVADPFCKKLIGYSGSPLVSTSANISGEPSPLLFKEIKGNILHRVDHVVNWRQDEKDPSRSSAIIKLEKEGGVSVIRP